MSSKYTLLSVSHLFHNSINVNGGIFSGVHARITCKEDYTSEDFKGKKVVKGICL